MSNTANKIVVLGKSCCPWMLLRCQCSRVILTSAVSIPSLQNGHLTMVADGCDQKQILYLISRHFTSTWEKPHPRSRPHWSTTEEYDVKAQQIADHSYHTVSYWQSFDEINTNMNTIFWAFYSLMQGDQLLLYCIYICWIINCMHSLSR